MQDPNAKKPEDWDELARIPDPDDKKPDDWTDVPKAIPDKDAMKPAEWDDEDDGGWDSSD
jgi:calreticulin